MFKHHDSIRHNVDTVSGEWCTHLVDFGICRVSDAKSEASRLEYQEADVYAIASGLCVDRMILFYH